MSTARINRIQTGRTNRAELLHRAGRQLPGTQVNREEARTRRACEQTGPCLTPRRSRLMERDGEKRQREKHRGGCVTERQKKNMIERESEWEGGRCFWWGGLAECDIQSGDESQHKKLKAAAEISRLISIQIRHKFYMPNV